MSIKYRKAKDGEWIAPMKDYRLACCDCGLVHKIEFALEPIGKRRKRIVFRAWRDNRATAQIRRHKQMGVKQP